MKLIVEERDGRTVIEACDRDFKDGLFLAGVDLPENYTWDQLTRALQDLVNEIKRLKRS